MVDELQEFEYLATVLHGSLKFVGHIGPIVPISGELVEHLLNFGVFITIIIKISYILNGGTYLIPSLTCFH